MILKAYKYKLQLRKIVVLILYDAAQLIVAYLFLDITQKVNITITIVLSSIAMFIIMLSIVPIKIIFDSMIEKITVDEEYEFLMRKEESDKRYFSMMEKYQDDMAKVRHDFANQLELAYGL
jgi:hypothetical protein